MVIAGLAAFSLLKDASPQKQGKKCTTK